jgi:predicted enzyme related to lactoylglutathione lyase
METTHPHGLFTWVDVALADPEAGREFYTALFGWEVTDRHDEDGTYVYTLFTKDGKVVAGLGPMPPGSATGMPPTWASYINVDDVDEITASAEDNGATVIFGPMDVMSAGRMAVIADPEGAVVSFWQPGDNPGAELFNVPGALTWNALATRDTAAAREFYGAVLPWTFTPNDRAPTEYWVIDLEGKEGDDPSNGGIIAMNEDWGDIPANWMPYFGVVDTAAAATRVSELGGTVLVPPFDTQMGAIAVVSDPEGTVFSVWSPSASG